MSVSGTSRPGVSILCLVGVCQWCYSYIPCVNSTASDIKRNALVSVYIMKLEVWPSFISHVNERGDL